MNVNRKHRMPSGVLRSLNQVLNNMIKFSQYFKNWEPKKELHTNNDTAETIMLALFMVLIVFIIIN